MKKYLKIVLVPTISILTIPFIFSLANLFKISIHPLVYLIITILIMFITGILTGLICEEKAYLKGIALGTIICLVMFLLSFIFRSNHSLYILIYYLIIIASTTLGAMIGVNKKKG